MGTFRLKKKTKQTFCASFTSSWVPLASSAAPRIPRISQYLHSCVEIVLSEVSLGKNSICSEVYYHVYDLKIGFSRGCSHRIQDQTS